MDAEKAKQLLDIARIGAENIASDIPDKIDPASVSTTATIPFRALVIRTVMRARVAELAVVACDLFDKGKKVSAFILIRSVLESVAIINAVNERIQKALDDGMVGESGEYLLQLGWGSKNDLTPTEAINVLTLIAKLDKKFQEHYVQNQYDDLSEVAHPNWGGVIGSYGDFDSTELYEVIDKHGTKLPTTIGLQALVTAIMLFETVYNETASLLPEYSNLCESELPKA